jgi:hypothetical protein
MNSMVEKQKLVVLIVGDMVALGVVTLAGFARHGTLETGGWRILATFVPLVLAWLMIAPFLGAYDFKRMADWRQLWRPAWAMVLGGPLAAWLRALALGNGPIIPVFVGVLSGVGALAVLAWRALYTFLLVRKL